jgi:hypothetical protein
MNQKEEDHEPARLEKLSLRMSFVRLIENLVEELLEGMLGEEEIWPKDILSLFVF